MGHLWLEFTSRALQHRPGVIRVLRDLRTAGYKVGLISDCAIEVQLHWQHTPFARLIDVSILSCSVKVKKTDPRIYRLASEQLSTHPHHCLYIGDRGSHELTSAAEAGFHPVLLTESEQESVDNIRPDAEKWSGHYIALITEVLELVDASRPDFAARYGF